MITTTLGSELRVHGINQTRCFMAVTIAEMVKDLHIDLNFAPIELRLAAGTNFKA